MNLVTATTPPATKSLRAMHLESDSLADSLAAAAAAAAAASQSTTSHHTSIDLIDAVKLAAAAIAANGTVRPAMLDPAPAANQNHHYRPNDMPQEDDDDYDDDMAETSSTQDNKAITNNASTGDGSAPQLGELSTTRDSVDHGATSFGVSSMEVARVGGANATTTTSRAMIANTTLTIDGASAVSTCPFVKLFLQKQQHKLNSSSSSSFNTISNNEGGATSLQTTKTTAIEFNRQQQRRPSHGPEAPEQCLTATATGTVAAAASAIVSKSHLPPHSPQDSATDEDHRCAARNNDNKRGNDSNDDSVSIANTIADISCGNNVPTRTKELADGARSTSGGPVGTRAESDRLLDAGLVVSMESNEDGNDNNDDDGNGEGEGEGDENDADNQNECDQDDNGDDDDDDDNDDDEDNNYNCRNYHHHQAWAGGSDEFTRSSYQPHGSNDRRPQPPPTPANGCPGKLTGSATATADGRQRVVSMASGVITSGQTDQAQLMHEAQSMSSTTAARHQEYSTKATTNRVSVFCSSRDVDHEQLVDMDTTETPPSILIGHSGDHTNKTTTDNNEHSDYTTIHAHQRPNQLKSSSSSSSLSSSLQFVSDNSYRLTAIVSGTSSATSIAASVTPNSMCPSVASVAGDSQGYAPGLSPAILHESRTSPSVGLGGDRDHSPASLDLDQQSRVDESGSDTGSMLHFLPIEQPPVGDDMVRWSGRRQSSLMCEAFERSVYGRNQEEEEEEEADQDEAPALGDNQCEHPLDHHHHQEQQHRYQHYQSDNDPDSPTGSTGTVASTFRHTRFQTDSLTTPPPPDNYDHTRDSDQHHNNHRNHYQDHGNHRDHHGQSHQHDHNNNNLNHRLSSHQQQQAAKLSHHHHHQDYHQHDNESRIVPTEEGQQTNQYCDYAADNSNDHNQRTRESAYLPRPAHQQEQQQHPDHHYQFVSTSTDNSASQYSLANNDEGGCSVTHQNYAHNYHHHNHNQHHHNNNHHHYNPSRQPSSTDASPGSSSSSSPAPGQQNQESRLEYGQQQQQQHQQQHQSYGSAVNHQPYNTAVAGQVSRPEYGLQTVNYTPIDNDLDVRFCHIQYTELTDHQLVVHTAHLNQPVVGQHQHQHQHQHQQQQQQQHNHHQQYVATTTSQHELCYGELSALELHNQHQHQYQYQQQQHQQQLPGCVDTQKTYHLLGAQDEFIQPDAPMMGHLVHHQHQQQQQPLQAPPTVPHQHYNLTTANYYQQTTSFTVYDPNYHNHHHYHQHQYHEIDPSVTAFGYEQPIVSGQYDPSAELRSCLEQFELDNGDCDEDDEEEEDEEDQGEEGAGECDTGSEESINSNEDASRFSSRSQSTETGGWNERNNKKPATTNQPSFGQEKSRKRQPTKTRVRRKQVKTGTAATTLAETEAQASTSGRGATKATTTNIAADQADSPRAGCRKETVERLRAFLSHRMQLKSSASGSSTASVALSTPIISLNTSSSTTTGLTPRQHSQNTTGQKVLQDQPVVAAGLAHHHDHAYAAPSRDSHNKAGHQRSLLAANRWPELDLANHMSRQQSGAPSGVEKHSNNNNNNDAGKKRSRNANKGTQSGYTPTTTNSTSGSALNDFVDISSSINEICQPETLPTNTESTTTDAAKATAATTTTTTGSSDTEREIVSQPLLTGRRRPRKAKCTSKTPATKLDTGTTTTTKAGENDTIRIPTPELGKPGDSPASTDEHQMERDNDYNNNVNHIDNEAEADVDAGNRTSTGAIRRKSSGAWSSMSSSSCATTRSNEDELELGVQTRAGKRRRMQQQKQQEQKQEHGHTDNHQSQQRPNRSRQKRLSSVDSFLNPSATKYNPNSLLEKDTRSLGRPMNCGGK